MNLALSLRPYPFERLRACSPACTPPPSLHAHRDVDRRAAAPSRRVRRSTRVPTVSHTLGSYPSTPGMPQLRSARAQAGSTRRFGSPPGAVESGHDGAAGQRHARSAVRVRAGDDESPPQQPLVRDAESVLSDLRRRSAARRRRAATSSARAQRTHYAAGSRRRARRGLEALPGAVPVHARAIRPAPSAGIDYLQRALELADRYDFIDRVRRVLREIYLDEARAAAGAAAGRARRRATRDFERCVVFHSLSKRSSVPGLRSGFVAGDAAAAQGVPARTAPITAARCRLLTQLASIRGVERRCARRRRTARLYREKFAAVLPILRDAHGRRHARARSFYLWAGVGGR